MTASFVPTRFSQHCLEFVWECQKSRDWKSMWIQLKHCRSKYIWTVTGRNLATDQIHHMTVWRTCRPIHKTMCKVSVLELRLFSKRLLQLKAKSLTAAGYMHALYIQQTSSNGKHIVLPIPHVIMPHNPYLKVHTFSLWKNEPLLSADTLSWSI